MSTVGSAYRQSALAGTWRGSSQAARCGRTWPHCCEAFFLLHASSRCARCASLAALLAFGSSLLSSFPPTALGLFALFARGISSCVRCVRRLPVWGCCLPMGLLSAEWQGRLRVGGVSSPSAFSVGGGVPPTRSLLRAVPRTCSHISVQLRSAPCAFSCPFGSRVVDPPLVSHATLLSAPAGQYCEGGSRGGRW